MARKILVVDDESDVVELTKARLKASYYEVIPITEINCTFAAT